METLITHLFRDAGRAFRVMWKSPGFAAVAVLSLALGIGANVSVFSAARAVALNRGPSALGDRLVAIVPVNHFGDLLVERHVRRLQHVSAFSSVAGCGSREGGRLSGGPAALVSVVQITPGYLELFGARPQRGRLFTEEDFGRGVRRAIVSDRLWRAHLGGASDAVGSVVTVRGESYTVVGIMEPDFSAPCLDDRGDARLWTTVDESAPAASQRPLAVFAALAPGVEIEAAQAELDATIRPSADNGGDRRETLRDGVFVERVGESTAAASGPGLFMLQGTAALLLLITCANLANLFLANVSARQHEFVVRMAVGASRRRVVGQVLVEAGVIATVGAIVGVFMAYVASRWLSALAAPLLQVGARLSVDWQELVLALGIGMVTAVIFGSVPAVVASRGQPDEALRMSSRATGSVFARRFRSSLVASQVFLAIVLLASAGLLVRSFFNVWSVPVGFEQKGLVTTDVLLPRGQSLDDFRRTITQLRAEWQSTQGASAIAFSHVPIYHPGQPASPSRWSVKPPQTDTPFGISAQMQAVSDDYLEVLRVRLSRGRRELNSAFGNTGPSAIINEAFARQYGGDQDLLGGEIYSVAHNLSFRIVGVVGDVHSIWLTQPPPPRFYIPITLVGTDTLDTLSIAVRGSNPGATSLALRTVLERVDLGLPTTVEPIATTIWRFEERRRFYSVLASLLAGLAALVTVVGIYGVVTHVTRQRRPELAVRLALGAQPIRLRWFVIRQAMTPIVAGAAAGIVGAWLAARLVHANAVLGAFLFRVSPHDQWTLLLVPVSVAAVAFVACRLAVMDLTRFDVRAVLQRDGRI